MELTLSFKAMPDEADKTSFGKSSLTTAEFSDEGRDSAIFHLISPGICDLLSEEAKA